MRFLGSKYAKNAFAPGPRWGAYSAPQSPSWIWGPLRGRDRRGGDRRGGVPETAYSRYLFFHPSPPLKIYNCDDNDYYDYDYDYDCYCYHYCYHSVWLLLTYYLPLSPTAKHTLLSRRS